MERLTKIDKYGHPYTNENINCRNLISKDGVNYQYVGYVDNFKAFDGKPIDKLCKLEDIEQELGIPLEVLFKALKDGVKVKTYDDDIEEEVILDFEPEELVFDYVLKAITTGRDYIEYDFEFEDYGKTWALTREELEDAKD